MNEIKSAMEIAMEKVGKLGEVTTEERLKWKYVPEGERLAGRYIKENCNLVVELGKYEEENAKKYVMAGATEILIKNINLPKNDSAKQINRQVMEGLKTLKSDKVAVENIYSKIRRLFSHYAEQGEGQRRQTYQALKTEFEAKVQQAIQQQLGSVAGLKIDVEKQPQFQEEWRKVEAQLDSQYLKLLTEHKQELSTIA